MLLFVHVLLCCNVWAAREAQVLAKKGGKAPAAKPAAPAKGKAAVVEEAAPEVNVHASGGNRRLTLA